MNHYNEPTQALITEVIDRTEALNYSIVEFKTWIEKRLENKTYLYFTYINSVKDKSNKLETMLIPLMSVSICNKATGDLIVKTLQEAYISVEAAKDFIETSKVLEATDEDPK